MIFNSLTFLVFLSCVVLLYWTAPARARQWLLLISSLLFYGFWRFDFVALMLVSSTTDYFVALALHRTQDSFRRKLLLAMSLSINLGLLFYFKYLVFAAENILLLGEFLGFTNAYTIWQIVLPLGISFYTFQTISYTIDVYRGFVVPERDYVLYSVFVMFFPQLVAGPILRIKEVLPQLVKRPTFQLEFLITGIQRILFGLFLKVVLADNIASTVDAGFDDSAGNTSALDVWTLAFLFGFQIYFDFSAYSHIAIGCATMMGIRFPENFCFPYFAVSPRDFWRRWHISLSSWIRDYLYLPLAGEKVRDDSTGGLSVAAHAQHSHRRWLFALFVTWAIMGFWHGAAWKFLVWGLWHASLIQLYRSSSSVRVAFPLMVRTIGGWVLTVAFVMLSWIPFRAKDLEQTFAMLSTVANPLAYTELGLRENTYLIAAIIWIAMICTFVVYKWIIPLRQKFPSRFLIPETAVYTLAFVLVFVFLRPVEQFIYFQF